ncbi:extracellular calcium-sensing receptor-like [Protopterus annectens]|uniref:extracellular calcium-sensing receptor-like n=1 Tax=Protopterus annectens TaxID=7888 RepID=UPI001CFABD2A|nr:extracellular calcium-sensing receptor-like [Protopterus annectens]
MKENPTEVVQLQTQSTMGEKREPTAEEISHSATLSAFSNKQEFPSFLRTIPGNQFQKYAMAQLVRLFGWTLVGIVAADNEVGETGSQEIKREIEASGGCIAFLIKTHSLYSSQKIANIAEITKRSTANVVIIHSNEVYAKPLLEMLYLQNVTGKVFIFSASFVITLGLFHKEMWKLFNGTLGLVPSTSDMPGFRDFIYSLHPSTSLGDIFIKLFWQQIFNCKWPENNTSQTAIKENDMETLFCTGLEKLEDRAAELELNDLSCTYQSYLAAKALAHAFNNMISCKSSYGPFFNRSCSSPDYIQPWQVLHYVKNVHFFTSSEEILFDRNGDAVTTYDIINLRVLPEGNYTFKKVGKINPRTGAETNINATTIRWNEKYSGDDVSAAHRSGDFHSVMVMSVLLPTMIIDELNSDQLKDSNDCQKCLEDEWPNEEHDKCIPKSIEFLMYEEPLGAVLATTAIILCFSSVSIFCIFVKHQDTPVVRANNRELSYLLLLSLMLCFLCALIFIGHPGKVTCLLRQTVFGVTFSICVSSVLAKTITVVIAFKATNPNSVLRKWMGLHIPYSLVIFCPIMQIIICVIWVLHSPPYPEMNINYADRQISIECNEGHPAFFYCMLGYMGLLAIVSFFVAFLARRLPSTFNEAKYITFSMLVYVSVWLSFIPAYLSIKGKYMVAVEIFAILTSSAGLLVCIFLSKCYIILLKPSVNTNEHLIGKRTIKNVMQ